MWDSVKLTEIGGQAIEGSFFSNHYSQEDPSPTVQDFIKEYQSKFGGTPDGLAALGYDAAMLLACAANDWALDGYLDPEHPLQKRILDVLERFTGERPAATGVDGCGAPVHAISLHALARGIQKITTSATSSPFALFREAAALTEAVRANGWAVAGPGRPDSVAIERLGVFSKFGAEGVQVMTAPDGTTVALKMLDGSPRALAIVAARLLVGAGALEGSAVDAVERDLGLEVLGGGAVVGRIRATV